MSELGTAVKIKRIESFDINQAFSKKLPIGIQNTKY